MAYKKPQIVAKSAAKQIFVAGCPTNKCRCYGTDAESKRCASHIMK